MTLVLIGKGLVLGGWPSKIEVIQVLCIDRYIYIYISSMYDPLFVNIKIHRKSEDQALLQGRESSRELTGNISPPCWYVWSRRVSESDMFCMHLSHRFFQPLIVSFILLIVQKSQTTYAKNVQKYAKDMQNLCKKNMQQICKKNIWDGPSVAQRFF